MHIRRGDIFYIKKAPAVGSEQQAARPAVIVSNDKNNQFSSTVEVVYLTTQPKAQLPTHVTINSTNRKSTVLCEQVSTVSVERLGNYLGHVAEAEMQEIEGAILISLGIERSANALSVRLAEAENWCSLLEKLYSSPTYK